MEGRRPRLADGTGTCGWGAAWHCVQVRLRSNGRKLGQLCPSGDVKVYLSRSGTDATWMAIVEAEAEREPQPRARRG